MEIWEITFIIIFLIVLATMQITLNKILEVLERIENRLNKIKRGGS